MGKIFHHDPAAVGDGEAATHSIALSPHASGRVAEKAAAPAPARLAARPGLVHPPHPPQQPQPADSAYVSPLAVRPLGAAADSSYRRSSARRPTVVTLRSTIAPTIKATTYEERSTDYFDKRQITTANVRVFDQVGLLLAIQLSGLPNGWASFLEYGYGSMLAAILIVNVMFWGLSIVMAEMMSMLPFTGGMSTFARAAFGPYVGYLIGQCEIWEYVLSVGSNLIIVGNIFTHIVGTSSKLEPLWWIVQLGIFLGAQIIGTRFLLRTISVINIVFIVSSLATVLPLYSNIDINYWAINLPYAEAAYDSLPTANSSMAAALRYSFSDNSTDWLSPNATDWLSPNATFNDAGNDTSVDLSQFYPASVWEGLFPAGAQGIFACIAPAIVLFLGIEALPLMAEDSSKYFTRDGPRSIIISMVITSALYWLAIVVLPAVAPGAYELQSATFQNLDPFAVAFGIDSSSGLYLFLAFMIVVTSLLSGTLGLLYSASRIMFALARSGYMPTIVAWTKIPGLKHQIPLPASLFSILATCFIVAVSYLEGGEISDILSAASVYYACICYVATGLSFLYLRFQLPHVTRKFNSGYAGIPSAILIILTAGFGFVETVITTESHVALYLCIGKLALGTLEMIIFHRKHLVLSPEEVFIQSHLGIQIPNIDVSKVSMDAEVHASNPDLARVPDELDIVIEEDEEGTKDEKGAEDMQA
ncbi:amino acid permease-domain-containing protein [Zopfochytrium polystomum]|nr:amino acid permease-domain-containing protein [Zopfochytrium polystomum]